jgi:hypothetical protein
MTGDAATDKAALPFDEREDAMAFYAFRYCLTQPESVARQCVDYLAANWQRLSGNTRLMIQLEVARTTDRARPGPVVSREWARLIAPDLPVEREAMISADRRQQVAEGAIAIIGNWQQPLTLDLDITFLVALIGQLALAFRHPHNTGPTRALVEGFARDVIEQLDPHHGHLYEFLMMSLDERYDQ